MMDGLGAGRSGWWITYPHHPVDNPVKPVDNSTALLVDNSFCALGIKIMFFVCCFPDRKSFREVSEKTREGGRKVSEKVLHLGDTLHLAEVKKHFGFYIKKMTMWATCG